MKRKARSHPRNIRRSRFRDNTVINQGVAHIQLSDQPSRSVINVIPYPRNEDFINRPDIVNRLDELLPDSSDSYNAALCGLGGSGYVLPSGVTRPAFANNQHVEKHRLRLTIYTADVALAPSFGYTRIQRQRLYMTIK